MARTISTLALATAVLAGGMALHAGLSLAAPTNPEDVIAGRQANYRDLGGAYRELLLELKKAAPMKFLVGQYVSQLSDLAQEQEKWFPEGSGPDSGYPTAAKPEVWTNPADFKKISEDLKVEAKKLAQIPGGPDKVELDKDELFEQLRVTVVHCKSCHDKYKIPSEHDLEYLF